MTRFLIAGLQHAHIRTLFDKINATPDCEVVGVYDGFCDENFGIRVNYDDFHEMLNNVEADVLAVGDAYGRRGGLILEGLKAGLNIISDKPLCISMEELDAVRDLAYEKNAVIGCMLDLRENRNFAAAGKYISEGLIGKVRSIQFNGQHPLNYGKRPMWYFEDGMHGGTINDIGIHALDMCEFLLGCEIANINFAESWNTFAAHPDFKDGGRMAFTMADGCRCMGDVSYFAPDGIGFSTPIYWRFTIWGEKGVMEFNYNDPGINVAVNGEDSVRRLDGMDCEITDLESFLTDIAGGKVSLNTEHVLNISEKALQLQKKSLTY